MEKDDKAQTSSIKKAIAAGRAGTPVEIAELRKKFPGMSKAEFDAEIMKLARSGEYDVNAHRHPAQATEAEKAGMVEFVNKGSQVMPDVPRYYYAINKQGRRGSNKAIRKGTRRDS